MQIPLIVFILFFFLLYLKLVRNWKIDWLIVFMPFWIGPVGIVLIFIYAMLSK